MTIIKTMKIKLVCFTEEKTKYQHATLLLRFLLCAVLLKILNVMLNMYFLKKKINLSINLTRH